MAVQYYEPRMDEIEKKKNVPFVGYINPKGQLIDYTSIIGEQTHCSTKNPASMMFLQFISYAIKGFDPKELKFFWDEDGHIYKNNITAGFDDVIKRGFDYHLDYNSCSYDEFLQKVNSSYEARQKLMKDQIDSQHSPWDIHVYEQLQNDLMFFFKRAYQNKDFFQALGIIPQVMCYEDFLETQRKEIEDKIKQFPWMSNRSDKDFYNQYQIAQLMSYFKDILVMYMGYDSIERRLKLDPNRPTRFKVITTSATNPNERFYNWILMDWDIQRIPKMYWNKEENRFIQENPIIDYYQTDRERILGEEISSIKKEVPKQYRKKYFRD